MPGVPATDPLIQQAIEHHSESADDRSKTYVVSLQTMVLCRAELARIC